MRIDNLNTLKRLLVIISAICILILAASVFFKPLVMMLARKQLGGVFIQSRVSVRGFSFKPSRELLFTDIEIIRQDAYEIKIKEAKVQYDLFSLLNPGSLKLVLKKARVFINTPEKGIREFSGYLKIGSRNSPFLGYAEVLDFKLDLNARDLSAKADLSCGIDILGQTADYLDFNLGSLEISGVQLEGASMEITQGTGKGRLSLSGIKYDKLNITDIEGEIRLEGKKLSLLSVKAKALGGELLGDFDCEIGQGVKFEANLECSGLDIEEFVRDFNLREKFEMTGKLEGGLIIGGDMGGITMLKGHFSTLVPGGVLIINDTGFLENMAQRTKQPLDLLVESFKNYDYNMGVMTLGIEESGVVFKMGLDGQAGKRNLSVVLHDFKL